MPDSVCVHGVVIRADIVRHKTRTEDLFACWYFSHDHSRDVAARVLQSGRHPEHQYDCQTAANEPARQYADPNE